MLRIYVKESLQQETWSAEAGHEPTDTVNQKSLKPITQYGTNYSNQQRKANSRNRSGGHKHTLEPQKETEFEAYSYGFLPGRSCHDAIEQCFLRLQKGRDIWVLDAELKG